MIFSRFMTELIKSFGKWSLANGKSDILHPRKKNDRGRMIFRTTFLFPIFLVTIIHVSSSQYFSRFFCFFSYSA